MYVCVEEMPYRGKSMRRQYSPVCNPEGKPGSCLVRFGVASANQRLVVVNELVTVPTGDSRNAGRR